MCDSRIHTDKARLGSALGYSRGGLGSGMKFALQRWHLHATLLGTLQTTVVNRDRGSRPDDRHLAATKREAAVVAKACLAGSVAHGYWKSASSSASSADGSRYLREAM
jgi:hypothetical protein